MEERDIADAPGHDLPVAGIRGRTMQHGKPCVDVVRRIVEGLAIVIAQLDLAEFQLLERPELSLVRHAVLVAILPDPQLGPDLVLAVQHAVLVEVEFPLQRLQIGIALLAPFREQEFLGELDLPVARAALALGIEIDDEKAVIAMRPARPLPEPVAVHIEADGRPERHLDPVAVEVDDDG
jgi:hypothetical protein